MSRFHITKTISLDKFDEYVLNAEKHNDKTNVDVNALPSIIPYLSNQHFKYIWSIFELNSDNIIKRIVEKLCKDDVEYQHLPLVTRFVLHKLKNSLLRLNPHEYIQLTDIDFEEYLLNCLTSDN